MADFLIDLQAPNVFVQAKTTIGVNPLTPQLNPSA
jgi:hypothetical protein